MNRLVPFLHPGRSADALRLWGLIAVLTTVSQLNEALVDATVAQEITYWAVRFLVFAASLFLAQWWIGSALQDRLETPTWLKPVVLVSALALLPFTFAELLLESRMPMVPEYDDGELMAISPALAYAAELGTNMTIVIPLHFLVWLLVSRHVGVAGEAESAPQITTPEFLNKTHGLRLEDVQAVKAEEHYILVYTSSGSELIHHKFGAAVTELPDTVGLQVHRSWWIADSKVAHSQRGARRWRLTMDCGVEVPVSDGYTQAARARGLLKRQAKRASL